jgi:hypothetical protein
VFPYNTCITKTLMYICIVLSGKKRFEIDWFLVFNTTFSNIWAISLRSVLLVEETRVPGEYHRPAANFIT